MRTKSKKCSYCFNEFTLGFYPIDRRTKDGRSNACKQCKDYIASRRKKRFTNLPKENL